MTQQVNGSQGFVLQSSSQTTVGGAFVTVSLNVPAGASSYSGPLSVTAFSAGQFSAPNSSAAGEQVAFVGAVVSFSPDLTFTAPATLELAYAGNRAAGARYMLHFLNATTGKWERPGLSGHVVDDQARTVSTQTSHLSQWAVMSVSSSVVPISISVPPGATPAGGDGFPAWAIAVIVVGCVGVLSASSWFVYMHYQRSRKNRMQRRYLAALWKTRGSDTAGSSSLTPSSPGVGASPAQAPQTASLPKRLPSAESPPTSSAAHPIPRQAGLQRGPSKAGGRSTSFARQLAVDQALSGDVGGEDAGSSLPRSSSRRSRPRPSPAAAEQVEVDVSEHDEDLDGGDLGAGMGSIFARVSTPRSRSRKDLAQV